MRLETRRLPGIWIPAAAPQCIGSPLPSCVDDTDGEPWADVLRVPTDEYRASVTWHNVGLDLPEHT